MLCTTTKKHSFRECTPLRPRHPTSPAESQNRRGDARDPHVAGLSSPGFCKARWRLCTITKKHSFHECTPLRPRHPTIPAESQNRPGDARDPHVAGLSSPGFCKARWMLCTTTKKHSFRECTPLRPRHPTTPAESQNRPGDARDPHVAGLSSPGFCKAGWMLCSVTGKYSFFQCTPLRLRHPTNPAESHNRPGDARDPHVAGLSSPGFCKARWRLCTITKKHSFRECTPLRPRHPTSPAESQNRPGDARDPHVAGLSSLRFCKAGWLLCSVTGKYSFFQCTPLRLRHPTHTETTLQLLRSFDGSRIPLLGLCQRSGDLHDRCPSLCNRQV